MSMLKPALFLVATLLTTGCSSNSEELKDSETKQIIPNYLKCDADHERANLIKSKYGNKFRGSGMSQAFLATANLPDEVLDYIFTKRSVSISLRGTGRGGRTNSGGGSISISSGVGSLAHEFGHAAHFSYLRDTQPTFQSALNNAYRYGIRSERSGMRGYSTSNSKDFFADLFDSYYCSNASRQNMQLKFPKSYDFIVKYLPLPPSEQTPNPDKDGDSVLNEADLCSMTASGAAVSDSAERMGCSEDQLLNSVDLDRDGIVNSDDLCSKTPIGAKTWKEGEYLGCSGGQTRD
jgi:hypothetical protein